MSDAGLQVFLQSSPPALVHLSLNQTAVTEETLTALRVCVPQLRLLSITHTRVTYTHTCARPGHSKDLSNLKTVTNQEGNP